MEQKDLTYYFEFYNKVHAFVTVGGSVQVIVEKNDGVDFISPSAFTQYYKNNMFYDVDSNGKRTKVYPATLWQEWKNRRTYWDVVFDPSDTSEEVYFNLWKGFKVKPDPEANCDMYWDHLLNTICGGDQRLYEYVRKWMAHAIQYPEVIPMVAIVLRGLQGTGKGQFVEPFGKLFGPAYFYCDNMHYLTGQFTGHLKDKIVIFADEALWGGNRKEEGVLKSLITSEHRSVEMKGKDAFLVGNYTRLFVASNNNWAVPVDMDDRRFVFCNVTTERKGDYKYWTKLAKEMHSGGLNRLMHDLMTEDLTGWNPLIRPEENAKLGMDMKQETMSLEQDFTTWFIQTQLDNLILNDNEQHVIDAEKFYELYQGYAPTGTRIKTKQGLSRAVWGKLLPREVKTVVTMKNGRKQISLLPNSNECKTYFEKAVHCQIEWNE